MKEYVCGFQINPNLNLVTLVRKHLPLWQRGLLNGIGGKVEMLCHCNHPREQHTADGKCTTCHLMRNMLVKQCPGFQAMRSESSLEAMRREFKEETGRFIKDWNLFATISGERKHREPDSTDAFRVHFFSSIELNWRNMGRYASEGFKEVIVDNEVIVVENMHFVTYNNSVPNLPWLLEMAQCIKQDKALAFRIHEIYTEPDRTIWSGIDFSKEA